MLDTKNSKSKDIKLIFKNSRNPRFSVDQLFRAYSSLFELIRAYSSLFELLELANFNFIYVSAKGRQLFRAFSSFFSEFSEFQFSEFSEFQFSGKFFNLFQFVSAFSSFLEVLVGRGRAPEPSIGREFIAIFNLFQFISIYFNLFQFISICFNLFQFVCDCGVQNHKQIEIN